MQDFNSIIQQYHPILYKIGRSYTGDDMDFEDLYQEMLIQLWQSLKHFKGDSKESTWIYRVVLNTALTFQRSKKRRAANIPTQAMPVHVLADQHDIEKDNKGEIELLYQCIRLLKKENRSVILLHLDGHQYDEIAEIVGISISNVGVKLNRIRKRLFNLLKEHGYGRV